MDPDQTDLDLQCFQKIINPCSAGQGFIHKAQFILESKTLTTLLKLEV